ncbi:MAG: UDP-N-acetylmuramoyl-L-alanyl-D-glutamate--2,6-diaminopimelate ligase [Chloroflexi bacterium]|nr:MAG: UDP-N-acetylmuramoyl-L-alanyl-D-glutamate--2,6-diaminopimelate ligase [Chloroflexota bacterium]
MVQSEPEKRSLKTLLAAWETAVSGTNLPHPPAYDGPDVLITHLTEKTNEVTPGACFVARVRATSDGHPYIPQAIANGASLILAQRPAKELDITLPSNVVYWQVPDTAETLAWLAAAWEGFPSHQLTVIGVTGTDGKTTTANLIHAILTAAGFKTGLLSTLRAVIGDEEEPLELHVTTPEAPVVQRYLRRMVDAGLTHCVLETTSHGLAQHRVTAVDFDVAVVTNITHEHLDYHGDYDGYLAAKARLFHMVSNPSPFKPDNVKTAVLNQDDRSFATLAQIPTPRQITYGWQPTADVHPTEVIYDRTRTWLTLNFNHPLGCQNGRRLKPRMTFSVPAFTYLPGEFNVYNVLAATAVARALNAPPEAIQTGLRNVVIVGGRMEQIDLGQPFLTIVDFAHTPNALEKAIQAGRHLLASRTENGRIITVFGSAGKRDIQKRRLMAEISARDADITILTAEDPRTESLADILEMMAEGCRSQGGIEHKTFWRVPDRGQAIYFALTLAQPDDLVLICGKGHEQSMCFGTTEYPWDDREATRTALKAFLAGEPMPDLGLPTYRPEGDVYIS